MGHVVNECRHSVRKKHAHELKKLTKALKRRLDIFLFYRKCLTNKPNPSFDEIWQHQIKKKALVERAFRISNKYQQTGYELIFYCLAYAMLKKKRDFSPEIETKTAIDGGPERVFIGVHNGLAPMTQYAINKGEKISYLTNNTTGITNSLLRTGINSCDYDCIPVDSNSLLRTRKAAKGDRMLLLNADFRDEDGKYKFISYSHFKAAALSNIPLYYYAATVNDKGHIELVIKGPFKGDSEALLSQFINFQNQLRPHARYFESKYKYKETEAYTEAQQKLTRANNRMSNMNKADPLHYLKKLIG